MQGINHDASSVVTLSRLMSGEAELQSGYGYPYPTTYRLISFSRSENHGGTAGKWRSLLKSFIIGVEIDFEHCDMYLRIDAGIRERRGKVLSTLEQTPPISDQAQSC